MNANGLPYSIGNTKVPFVIINFTPAKCCPSKALGLCQCPNNCYALHAEEMYKQVLPYRLKQMKWWKKATLKDVLKCADELELQRNRRKTQGKDKVLRFNEAGDFVNQAQVNLFAFFASRLITYGWKIYGYTARIDLDLSQLIALGVSLNLSGDSERYKNDTNRFKPVKQPTGNNFLCQGNCKTCNICRIVSGKTIEILFHGNRKNK